jgi:hypothetical protein
MGPVHNIKSQDDKQKNAHALMWHQNKVILSATTTAAAATIQYDQRYYFKVPYHTSSLTG